MRDEGKPRAEKKKNVIKITGLENSLPNAYWNRSRLISLFRSGSQDHPPLGFLPQIPQSKSRHHSLLPPLHPGEVNKLAIRGCFCLPAHPINDNLLGMNNVQADARRRLREFQLIPQKPTLLWQVPLQKPLHLSQPNKAVEWSKAFGKGSLWLRPGLVGVNRAQQLGIWLE